MDKRMFVENYVFSAQDGKLDPKKLVACAIEAFDIIDKELPRVAFTPPAGPQNFDLPPIEVPDKPKK